MIRPLLRRQPVKCSSYPSQLFRFQAQSSIPKTRFFHPSAAAKMSSAGGDGGEKFKFVFFVPHADVETCKDAVFDTGAGSFPGGKYTRACFQSSGEGQFLPGDGANPHLGHVGAVEKVEELKVEVLCLGRQTMTKAVEALLKAHPYEEPAYEVYKLENV